MYEVHKHSNTEYNMRISETSLRTSLKTGECLRSCARGDKQRQWLSVMLDIITNNAHCFKKRIFYATRYTNFSQNVFDCINRSIRMPLLSETVGHPPLHLWCRSTEDELTRPRTTSSEVDLLHSCPEWKHCEGGSTTKSRVRSNTGTLFEVCCFRALVIRVTRHGVLWQILAIFHQLDYRN